VVFSFISKNILTEMQDLVYIYDIEIQYQLKSKIIIKENREGLI